MRQPTSPNPRARRTRRPRSEGEAANRAILLLAALPFALLGCTATAGDSLPPRDVGGDGRDDGAEVFTCTDYDRDGYGPHCANGPDCDDGDAAHHDDCADCPTTRAPGCRCSYGETFDCYDGPPWTENVGACVGGTRTCSGGLIPEECVGQVLPGPSPDVVCNDTDDDCDGIGDEALTGPCGTCDPNCESDGETTPSVDDPEASGLAPNPDGPGVVLGAEDIHAGFLWAANDPEGTVSKLDLETGREVSRFRVGNWGNNCDSPSRTAVDGMGNAYVATRAHTCGGSNQGAVTKMAGDPMYCIDRNGNTVIETSTGSTPMPLGTDECMIWTVNVAGPGGIPRGLAVDLGDGEFYPGGFPWVAAYNEMRVYKLNPDDGSVLTSVNLNVNPYGLAGDRLGNIWVSGPGPGPGYLQKFNTETGAVDPPVAMGAEGGCGAGPYGITVDRMNRPWAAAWIGAEACATRYDPATGTWMAVRTGRAGWGGRGIAAAEDGTIWMSIHQNWAGGAMASWNMEDGSGLTIRDLSGGAIPVGIGLDELGHVWTVNQQTSNVSRLTIATGVIEEFPVGPSPYTYSDFTGYQRRRLTPHGTWIHDYHRCDLTAGDSWSEITWDVTAPPGDITIKAYSAPTADGLRTAPMVTLAEIPDAVPPVNIEAAFAAAGVPTFPFLRIEVLLEGTPDGASPVFRSVHVRWRCNIMG